MKFIAIFCVVLVAVSATSLYDKYPMNFSNKRSIMTLLTQVESTLKSGGPLDAITKMLSNFKTEINEEQANHDALWAGQQEECAGEFEFRAAEVQAADAAFKEATETLDGCTSQKVRAVGDLAITKKQLGQARSLLAVAVDQRRRSAYAFETYSTAFQMCQRGVEEALIILEEIWSGESSFAQLNVHINSMLKQTMKVRKAHLLGGVMEAFAQLSTQEIQADDALLNRVKTLITNFGERMAEQFNQSAAAEQASIEAFAEEKQRLENAIEQLQAQQQGLQVEIDTLNKCVVVQSSIVVSAAQKRDRNQRIWDDAKELCDAVEVEYKTSTEARGEELELLQAITERVEERFAEVSSDVTARGEQDAEDFSYDNATKYDDSGFQGGAV